MTRWLLQFMLACILATGIAHAAAPTIRVQVQGKQPALVGQQIRVDVTVLTPNFFTSAPPFPTLQIPGAIVTMPDDHGTIGTEQIDGETYASVQKTYVFAAQQEGDFALPPVKIEFTYGGDDGKPRKASLTMPPTKVRAVLPAGAAAAGGGALPVAKLTISQSFDRATTGLKAGDALVRTIDIFATQTQAMMIPPPKFEAPDGVKVFAADPVLNDETKERVGFLGGRRIDRVSYVFEKSGRYTLPAIEVRWFDAATGKPATAQAPAITVTVAAGARGDAIAPEAAIVGAPDAPARHRIDWEFWAWLVGAALVGSVGSWVFKRYVPGWRDSAQKRRAAHAISDDVMFAAVLDACSRNDAKATHAALLRWSARHARATPRAWAESLDDRAVETQIDFLERRLYAGGESWNGPNCAAALKPAHEHWQQSHGLHRTQRRRRPALGPLNPTFSKEA